MKKEVKGNSISASMIFKTLERYIVMGVQMIVQIVIARILSPEDYGVVSMMMVFISIATIFIQNGFNMSLVQKEKADAIDYSTALLINVVVGLVLYSVIALSSPLIAKFYNQPYITVCLPVMALLLVFGSVNSIQIAIATRQMQFRNLFKCNVVASFLSGIIGIVIALLGGGIWALVFQQLSSCIILSIMLFAQQHWKPSLKFNKKSASSMFSFGWKLLAAGLLRQFYTELNSLVIGKKYTSSDLAFYTKGHQFPKYVTMGVDSSISTVMLSAFSKNQNNLAALHEQIKKTISINSYLVIPCLGILVMVATPLVHLLLTDKWLPIVPFMQICCISCVTHPISAAQIQAITAVGRSGIRLKIELIKKSIGLAFLIVAIPYGPIIIAISAAVAEVIGLIINAFAGKKTTGYPLSHLVTDIFPSLMLSFVMMIGMYWIGKFTLSPIYMLIVQTIAGLVIYLGLSSVFHIYGFEYMKKFIYSKISKE